MGKQKYNFHSINIIWSLYSFVTESKVHDFRMMVVIYQPSNQFSHSFNNCSNFLELSVEILKLWNCHFKALVLYLAWMICHFEQHCNIRILKRSATVGAHSHTQFPLKIYKLVGDLGLSVQSRLAAPLHAKAPGLGPPVDQLDLLPDSRISPWAEGRRQTAEPPGLPWTFGLWVTFLSTLVDGNLSPCFRFLQVWEVQLLDHTETLGLPFRGAAELPQWLCEFMSLQQCMQVPVSPRRSGWQPSSWVCSGVSLHGQASLKTAMSCPWNRLGCFAARNMWLS